MNRYEEYQKGYDLKNRDKINLRKKYFLKKLRLEILEVMGNCCAKCGFSDYRALQIDHVNGGGSQYRKIKTSSRVFYIDVKRSFLEKENKYQLLCANCNWIKRYENKEIRK